jgi:hypothetical protein
MSAHGVRPVRLPPRFPDLRRTTSMPPIKKIVMWLVVVFLLYAILTSPSDAADIFGSAWEVVKNGVTNVATFFDSLIRGG